MDQVNYLVQELHDPNSFGRPYGDPLQAYSDPLDPGNGYFTHSVYPEWVFLNFKGLLNYGLNQEAEFIAQRLFDGIIQSLKDYHDFYESYYCDAPRPSDSWLHSYIWTGVVARMLIDLYGPKVQIEMEQNKYLPSQFYLFQNYPNPFNLETEIRFDLAHQEIVLLTVYDILGRKVKTLLNKTLPAGRYAVEWDSTQEFGQLVSSGIYFYRLETENHVQSRKMILLR